MTQELLPCPHCAGEAGIGSGDGYFFVNCCECLSSTDVLMGESRRTTRDAAIAAWNTRPSAQAVAVIDLGENGILHNAVVTGPVQVIAARPEQVSGNMFQPHGGWQPIAIAGITHGTDGGGKP